LIKPTRPELGRPHSPNDFFNQFFNRFFQGQPMTPHKERSLGSGFIISKDGYILTNNHVVDGADEIKVRLFDGRSYTAKVKGTDPKLDIALLKINAGNDLPAAPLGDSDRLEVGQWVMAIGNPFGLSETVTVGIVSAKGRVIGAGPYDDFIQTDASINPGNSGGPLFNPDGEVVGINTAIIQGGQGIGFAIPINEVKSVLEQLKTTGHVVRGYLGVTIQPMTEALAKSFGLKQAEGALVSSVIKGTPAERAGIKRGDVIVSYRGKKVENVSDLPRLVAETPVGQRVTVGLIRDGKRLEVKVKIGKLSEHGQKTEATGSTPGNLGLSVTDVTPDVAQKYNLQQDKGALITDVAPDSAAADANLRPGDLILEVNNRAVHSAGDFTTAVAHVKKGAILRLLVQRGDSVFYTTVQVE
jgi:serine protease Do